MLRITSFFLLGSTLFAQEYDNTADLFRKWGAPFPSDAEIQRQREKEPAPRWLVPVQFDDPNGGEWGHEDVPVSSAMVQDLIQVLERMERNQARMAADIQSIKSRVTALEQERSRRIRTPPQRTTGDRVPVPTPVRGGDFHAANLQVPEAHRAIPQQRFEAPYPPDILGNDGQQKAEWLVDPQNGIPVMAKAVWSYSRVGGAGVWQLVRSNGRPHPVTVWYGGDRVQEQRVQQQQRRSSQQGLNMNFGGQ